MWVDPFHALAVTLDCKDGSPRRTPAFCVKNGRKRAVGTGFIGLLATIPYQLIMMWTTALELRWLASTAHLKNGYQGCNGGLATVIQAINIEVLHFVAIGAILNPSCDAWQTLIVRVIYCRHGSPLVFDSCSNGCKHSMGRREERSWRYVPIWIRYHNIIALFTHCNEKTSPREIPWSVDEHVQTFTFRVARCTRIMILVTRFVHDGRN